MTLCPVALAVGCRKCPIFAICPLKSSIGDYIPPKTPAPAKAGAGKDTPKKGTAKKTTAKKSSPKKGK